MQKKKFLKVKKNLNQQLNRNKRKLRNKYVKSLELVKVNYLLQTV